MLSATTGPKQAAEKGPSAVTHLRWVPQRRVPVGPTVRWVRRCDVPAKYASDPACGWVPRAGYPSKMGDAALYLDLFEQPGGRRVFQ